MQVVNYSDLPWEKRERFKRISFDELEDDLRGLGFRPPTQERIIERLKIDIMRHLFVEDGGRYYYFKKTEL